MGVKEAFGDIIRVFIFIHVLMVDPVVGAPIMSRILEGSGAKEQHEQLDRPFGLKRQVREKSVVTQGDTEARGVIVEDEQGPDEAPAVHLINGIDRQVILRPEEPRYDRQGEQRRPDQENGSDPLDAIDWEVFELHSGGVWVR